MLMELADQTGQQIARGELDERNRLMRICLPSDAVLPWLTGRISLSLKDFPEGAEVVGAGFSELERSFVITVRHPSFRPVAFAEPIPTVQDFWTEPGPRHPQMEALVRRLETVQRIQATPSEERSGQWLDVLHDEVRQLGSCAADNVAPLLTLLRPPVGDSD